jgi:hypothetical protein
MQAAEVREAWLENNQVTILVEQFDLKYKVLAMPQVMCGSDADLVNAAWEDLKSATS